MKRILAAALVFALLALSFAFAEEGEDPATTLTMSDLVVSCTQGGHTSTVQLSDMTLRLMLGVSGSMPTIQVTFDNGAGQQVDGIFQVRGSKLLLSMGGISGVFFIDLNDTDAVGSNGRDYARLLDRLLPLAGAHLDVLLYFATVETGDGMRSVRMNVPAGVLGNAVESFISLMDNGENGWDFSLNELHDRAEDMSGSAQLSFRYTPTGGKFALSIEQEDGLIQVEGIMDMRVGKVTFVQIGDEEEHYDLTCLDEETLEQLRGEIGMIALKFIRFADGTGLDDIM